MPDIVEQARDGIAAAGIASEWLAVYAQEQRPDGRWLRRDEILADDVWVRETPALDRRLLWRGVPGRVAWPVAATTAGLLEATGRLLRVDPRAVRLRVTGAGDGARIDGVWFARVALIVPPGDPLAGAGAPDVAVAGRPARLAALAADLTAFMAPVVEAAGAGARVGARGLWGSVADCALPAFSEPRPGDAGPGDARARVAAFMEACAETPLARTPRWTTFAHRGESHATMRYCACCLAYRRPVDPEAPPRPDGLDPRWDRYCAACPLIPDAEVAHRARHRLDQPAETRTGEGGGPPPAVTTADPNPRTTSPGSAPGGSSRRRCRSRASS
jgi:hypothetical protein